mmetsp:Transcript_25239/g.81007  ORF Transcript_25239/g.81007 Transcript_25239/m.81007 type:complete len:194 (-) Transcript_25239:143-724(-)
MGSNEPSDAVRVVNALLTQLDQLRRFPNAIVLTTSNLPAAVDAAFIDRADIKQYVGPPGSVARYAILSSCIGELRRANALVMFEPLLPWAALQPLVPPQPPGFEVLQGLDDGGRSPAPRHSLMLHALAARCGGLSGRALRKLPFLAQALFLPPPAADGAAPDLPSFLAALARAIEHEQRSRGDLAPSATPMVG